MNLTTIFSILIIHWIADFILQTDKQAKGKSSNNKDLLNHTITYSMVWMIIGSILRLTEVLIIPAGYLSLFVFITFIIHTITDYFTSRLNKKLWNENKTHQFFVAIGFDQILHYIQLFLTFYLINKL